MQHHRAPTRLLDWSESPLVALYFATLPGDQDGEDSALWCLDPIDLNRKAKLNFAFDLELPAFKEKKLQSYLPSFIDAKSPMNPVAAIGPRSKIWQHILFSLKFYLSTTSASAISTSH